MFGLVLVVTPLLQGCITKWVVEPQERKRYIEYREAAERINLEREKAQLPPEKIMTIEEWHGGK
jgi:hypothetical protein